jgi:hypothetical protein
MDLYIFLFALLFRWLLLAAVDDCDYLVRLLLLLFVDPHLAKTPLFTLVAPMFHFEPDRANDEMDSRFHFEKVKATVRDATKCEGTRRMETAH